MGYLYIILAYLLGSIPFGLVVGKCAGIDVRKSGSGNIGATNVNRLLGKKLGALTLAADAFKALLPMLAVSWLLQGRPEHDIYVVLCGGAAFLGHLYPVYLKFRGGKGVATALGIFAYLQPLCVLAAVILFVAVVAMSGFVSLGSLVAAAAVPFLLFVLDGEVLHIYLAVFVAVLVWIKHKENIVRLLQGQENSWRKKA